MPLSTLDPIAALVVIDLQKGIVALPTAHPVSQVIARSAELASAFRERGLPVVLVNVTAAAPGRTDMGSRKFAISDDWAELVAELAQQPADILVTKQRHGAFISSSLDEYLRSRGANQVFLTGISTSAGVESTARSASDFGYNVVLVIDAMTDSDAEMHRHCVEKVFPKFAETDTTENVLKLLRVQA